MVTGTSDATVLYLPVLEKQALSQGHRHHTCICVSALVMGLAALSVIAIAALPAQSYVGSYSAQVLAITGFSAANSWKLIHKSGPGPTRSIVRRDNGALLGLWIEGNQLQTWTSTDDGATWVQLGSVTTDKHLNGDPNLLAIPHSRTMFSSFRLHYPEDDSWQVVVCRSDDDGRNWGFDSSVVGRVRHTFVGAPHLFLTARGDLQCYFDNEALPARRGQKGSQWVTMKQRHGTTGSWDAHGLTVVGAPPRHGVVRDGMPSVVQLDDPGRIMVVMEGVGGGANVVNAAESFDYGRTWKSRTRVYQAKTDHGTGKRFNAYVPWVEKPKIPGPAYVAFCTDEDFHGPPDPDNMAVDKRRCHVKMTQTTTSFERWSSPTLVDDGARHLYFPGLFGLNAKSLLSADLALGRPNAIHVSVGAP